MGRMRLRTRLVVSALLGGLVVCPGWAATAQDLLPGTTLSSPAGIDDLGRVVGYSTTQTFPLTGAPFLWSEATGLIDLSAQGFPNESPLAMSPGGAVATPGYWPDPGSCTPAAANRVVATLTVTDELGNPLRGITIAGRFLDDYWTDAPVTARTNQQGRTRFTYNGPACVGAVAFLVDDATGRGRVLDRTTGTLAGHVIPLP